MKTEIRHIVINESGQLIGAGHEPLVADGIPSIAISSELAQDFENGKDLRINENGEVESYDGQRAVQAQIDGLLTKYKSIVEKKEISDRKVRNFTEMNLTDKAAKSQKESDDLRAQLAGMYGQAVNAYGEAKVDAILFGE